MKAFKSLKNINIYEDNNMKVLTFNKEVYLTVYEKDYPKLLNITKNFNVNVIEFDNTYTIAQANSFIDKVYINQDLNSKQKRYFIPKALYLTLILSLNLHPHEMEAMEIILRLNDEKLQLTIIENVNSKLVMSYLNSPTIVKTPFGIFKNFRKIEKLNELNPIENMLDLDYEKACELLK